MSVAIQKPPSALSAAPQPLASVKRPTLMPSWMLRMQKKLPNGSSSSSYTTSSKLLSTIEERAISCKYKLQAGTTITLPGKTEGVVSKILGKGAFKRVYLLNAGDQMLAVTCTASSDDVAHENDRITRLLKHISGISHALLPSLFQEARIGRDRVFCQTTQAFDTSLSGLNKVLNQSLEHKEVTHYCIQIGDHPSKKASPFAFEMVLIHNITKVGSALLNPKGGVLTHLRKRRIAHCDLHPGNLFVNVDENGKITKVVIADWDLHSINAVQGLINEDTVDAGRILRGMPSITGVFCRAIAKSFNNSSRSIGKHYQTLVKGIRKATNAARKLKVPV